MRAITFHEYGTNDVLKLEDVAEPIVGPDSVLIRAKAVGVNPVDWKIVRGYLQGAFTSHLPIIPCWDIAGVVEAVGPAVVEFKPGDEVLAYNRQDQIQFGTLSELVAVPVRAVGHKVHDMSWEQAGALPLAGLTAFQALEAAEVRKDDTVLVNNASGGVGSVAVQLAARRGARVIGSASRKNHEYLRSIGAEPVEYGDTLHANVQQLVEEVDVALDFIGGDALDVSAKLLGSEGRMISIVDAGKAIELGGQYVFVHPNSPQLTELAALVGADQLKIEIAETFPFEKAADAFEMSEKGHIRGKIVITFD